jgi:hypothetical protein
MLTKGYHTLEDRGNVDEIEEWGPKQCLRKNAWLGDGYYFWDGDIFWAHDWGKKSYKDYLIFESEVTIDEKTFDLFGNTLHKKEFSQIIHELIKTGHFKSMNMVTVPKVIEYLKKYAGFNYNSIRAADYPNKAFMVSFGGANNEAMYLNERVQVCLITKKNLSLSSFRVIFPEHYVQ